MVPRDFSNEVFMDKNTSDYSVMLMTIVPSPRVDSLYHYNSQQNRLEARFTVSYPNKEEIPWPVSYTHLDVYKRQVNIIAINRTRA